MTSTERICSFLKVNYVLTALLFLCLLLKIQVDTGTAAGMKWMLFPLSQLASLMGGMHFSFEDGPGFVDHNVNIAIGANCSGINYMILLILIPAFSFLKLHAGKEQVLYALGLVVSAWALTCFVNASRIVFAAKLSRFNELYPVLAKAKVHEGIGILYFLLFLLCYYYALRYYFHSKNKVYESIA